MQVKLISDSYSHLAIFVMMAWFDEFVTQKANTEIIAARMGALTEAVENAPLL